MKLARILSIHCGSLKAEDAGPQEIRDANVRMISETLALSSAYRPDFICFPEIVLQGGISRARDRIQLAEPQHGLFLENISKEAVRLQCYILMPILEKADKQVYNSVFFIRPDGMIGGVYRKFHATGYEIHEGVTPGAEIPVWDTPFGRIGTAICFDLKFPDVGLALSRKNTQCVFWPTMFMGGRRMDAWAMDYGFFLVSCHAAGGRVVTPDGMTVAASGPMQNLSISNRVVRFTFAEVNLDHRTYHYDFHREKILEIQKKYGPGIRIRPMPDEGIFNLSCELNDRTIDDIEREFGLTPLRTYLDEADRIREEALKRIHNEYL